MVATGEQESTFGVFQNMISYLATGSAMYQHEVNGGLKYMSALGFNYDASNIIAGANNFDGDANLVDKESLGDKIIAVLSA
jgi:hypothetical protein